jgi:hypothetical protein
MRKSLALKGWSKESEHNMEIPTETEFNDQLCPTAGKQRLLSYHYLHRQRSFFSKQGRKEEITWNMDCGITVNK